MTARPAVDALATIILSSASASFHRERGQHQHREQDNEGIHALDYSTTGTPRASHHQAGGTQTRWASFTLRLPAIA